MTTHYGSGSAGTPRDRYRATPPSRPSAFWNDHTNHHTAAIERHTMTSAADIDTRIQAADARPHAPEALVERMARAARHAWFTSRATTDDDLWRDAAAAALRVVTERTDGADSACAEHGWHVDGHGPDEASR